MPDLGIQSIQFVIFKTNVDGDRASAIYTRFLEAEADATQVNRSPGPAAPFLSLATGVMNDRFYNFQVSPGRVDMHITHPDRPQSGPWAWKLAEGAQVAEESAKRLVDVILPSLGKSLRVATIVTLLRNCKSQAEASATIVERVGIKQLASAQDLAVQFSRRVPSSTKGYVLNRLLRFATSTSRDIIVNVTDGNQSFAGNERYLATMQIDINTVVTGIEIEPSVAKSLLIEMLGKAIVIAMDGTIDALDHQDA